MTLRRKGMLTIILTVAAAIVICLIVTQTILVRRFDELERRETRQNVSRAVSALYSDFSKISITSGSELTANTVVIDDEGTYLRLNIDQSTFATLGLNFILFAMTGQPPLGYGFDLRNGIPLAIPADLASQLSEDSPLMQPPEGRSGMTGILMLSEGPILVASYPTEVSINGLPFEGRLIFARYLDSSEVARLSDVTHLSLTLYRLEDPNVPARVRTAEPPAGGEIPTYVQALSSDTVAGYGVLDDIYDQPALVLEVDLPRDIHHQGQTTLLYLICALAAVGIGIGLAATYVTERTTLSRLLRLSNGVVHVRTTGDLSQRVDVSGSDELTTLEMSINSMLASLETSQRELRESEAQNRALVKGIPDFMLRIGADGTLLEARSAKGVNMLEPHRLAHGKMLYNPLVEYRDLCREVIAGGLAHMDQALKTGEAQIFEFELLVDAHKFFYEVRMMASNKQNELLAVVFDVTQRHEEVQKKEVLIKEIHHRVKNNLQVVSSLLYLQSKRLQDENVMRMFEESSNRVKSISLIHEKLYQERLHAHTEAGLIDFGEYVQDLTDALFTSYGVDRKSIRLILDTANAFLTLDSAVPCGLIINELISNSLKYAFPGGRRGEVRVGLYGETGDRMTLIVADNGVALPPDTDLENSTSLGLRLVKMLAQQLGADVQVNRSKGTEFRFTFTDSRKKEQESASTRSSQQPVGTQAQGG